jgi:MFS family permease
MLTGGKIGDILGRRRTFTIGLVIYAFGSALTAVAPSVAILTLGWSVLEGLGAALVLPAMVALIAGNFEGASRKVAYAVIGGVAGAGIAVGPILGGWATTEYSWRIIFAGEVLLVALILVMTPCCRPWAWAWSCSGCCSRARGAGSDPRKTRRSSPSASR